MGVELLGAPQQAFLALAGTVSHTGEVGAAMTTVGASLGFEKCQVETVPAAPDASAVAAWLHRGTAQAFGDFHHFPARMRIREDRGDGEVAKGVAGAVFLVSSTHFLKYQPAVSPADEFVLASAGVLAANAFAAEDKEIAKNLNMKIDEITWSEHHFHGSKDTRAKNYLKKMRITFVWQFLETFPTEIAFDEARKHYTVGIGTRNAMKETLKTLGLWFGMKFPAGFVKRTK